MNLMLAGPGAFGAKHLAALSEIEDVAVISLIGPRTEFRQTLAAQYGIPHTDDSLETALTLRDATAVVLATPTPLHAQQAEMCMNAGKHVAIEIPAGQSWPEVEALCRKKTETGLICSIGHTRRYNPPHQWIKAKTEAGDFSLQHMDVQTFFFRRENLNALGEPRDWTDHLLWHHAAHSVDLFMYQTGEPIVRANILEGPHHPDLNIAMDMSIQLQSASGALLSLSLSFNNDGPLGTVFRYIGDSGTYIASYDDLTDGRGVPIDLGAQFISKDGIELQNRDFVNAIRDGTDTCSSILSVRPCYEVLRDLEVKLKEQRRSLN